MAGYVAGGKFRPGLSGSVGYTTADDSGLAFFSASSFFQIGDFFRFDLGWTWAVTDDKNKDASAWLERAGSILVRRRRSCHE